MATAVIRPMGPGRALLLALALLIIAPAPATGQSGFKTNRRFIFGVGLGLGVGLPAYLFTEDDAFGSSCSSRQCVGIIAGLIGATVGYLIGAEFDSRYERRMAAGPSLKYDFRNISLNLVPDRITGFPGGAAVVGVGGARVVYQDGTVLPRAMGVRGIEDVAVLPTQDLLVLSTFSNLISFPVTDDTAQGQVIDERGGGSMEVFRDRLAVASFDSLRMLSLRGADGGISVETLAGVENLDYVTDMTFSDYGRVGWVLMEDRLVAYTTDLEKIGEIRLPAAGRSVRASGGRLAVAAGSNGVFVLDAADPESPSVVLQYEGVRFAYTADLEGDRLYVAAGSEGVAVVDIGGMTPQVVGVARNARFASDVLVAGEGQVWILDRDGRSVHIAEFGAGEAARASRADSGH